MKRNSFIKNAAILSAAASLLPTESVFSQSLKETVAERFNSALKLK